MAPPKILGGCQAAGCAMPERAKGYCNRHYQRWLRNGAPVKQDYYERLRRRLANKTSAPNADGCMLWLGAKAHFGHGIIVVHGKKRHAHRVSWGVHCGPIPEGMVVCHRCDVPACVNPDHLFLGTDADNFNDMRSKHRHAFGARNGIAKLTESEVLQIRADTRTNKAIAQDYGVTDVLISKIRRGEVWRHILPGVSRADLKREIEEMVGVRK